MRISLVGLVLLIPFFITACGGGGGGNGADDVANIEPPVIAVTGGDGEIVVQWANVTSVDNFTLYYATQGGIQPSNFGIWISQHDGVIIENVTSPFTVGGLENGTEYFFVVTANTGGEESDPSNEVSSVPTEGFKVTGELNDTGITFCGEVLSGNNDPCNGSEPRGQDATYGRDALATAGVLTKVGGGNAGFDFTKIANNGSLLPASAMLGSGSNDWACTRDNVTGLLWEVKVDNPSHLRHLSHTYTWYDPTSPDGNLGLQDGGNCIGSNCDTTGFAEAVNAQGLCGASDWRMPTRLELQGIIDYHRFEPAFDSAYFPNTLSTFYWYWSGSRTQSVFAGAWLWGFIGGESLIGALDTDYHVRLVRGGQ